LSKNVPSSTMKDWNTYIGEFADYLKLERSLSENSQKAYLSDIEKLQQYADIAQLEVSPLAITQQHLQDFLAYIYDLGLSPTSQARILAGIKAFYRFLLYQDLIEEDPSILLEGPKLDRKLPDTLNFQQIERACGYRNLRK
jgi:integrase/recombinase XerD